MLNNLVHDALLEKSEQPGARVGLLLDGGEQTGIQIRVALFELMRDGQRFDGATENRAQQRDQTNADDDEQKQCDSRDGVLADASPDQDASTKQTKHQPRDRQTRPQ